MSIVTQHAENFKKIIEHFRNEIAVLKTGRQSLNVR